MNAVTQSVPANKLGFESFGKMPRFSRDIVITEKLDGCNAQIEIKELPYSRGPWEAPPYTLLTRNHIAGTSHSIMAGSRSRWLSLDDDHFGFARWVGDHAHELVAGLGVGRHFGEWWGRGIQRGYGLPEKRFSLFNVGRWISQHENAYDRPPRTDKQQFAPACCHVVPTIYSGPFLTDEVDDALGFLAERGSVAAPGYMNPEGVVIYHTAGNLLFKKTIRSDDEPKSANRQHTPDIGLGLGLMRNQKMWPFEIEGRN